MDDEIKRALSELRGSLPQARQNLSEAEKDELVAKIGPRTCRDILSLKRTSPLRRIPFLFSSIDTQAIVDLLENDCEAAVKRGLVHKS